MTRLCVSSEVTIVTDTDVLNNHMQQVFGESAALYTLQSTGEGHTVIRVKSCL